MHVTQLLSMSTRVDSVTYYLTRASLVPESSDKDASLGYSTLITATDKLDLLIRKLTYKYKTGKLYLLKVTCGEY